MYAKKYASVIQGLKTMLDMQDKNEVRLDYNLLSNLTFSILNEKTLHETQEGEETEEEEEAKQVHLDEDLFDHLNEVLSGLEEKLDDEYEDEAEEESKEKEVTENDRQFLIKKLTELFDQIQKKVALRSVSES